MESDESNRPFSASAQICMACQLHGFCLPGHLGAEVLETLSTIVKARPPVPRGTYLFNQGAPMTAYYFLRSGSAKAIVDDDDGRESVTAFLLPSDIVGAGAMQRPVYYDSVVTLERSAYCSLAVSDLTALFRDRPEIRDNFESKITNRIHMERHARTRLDHTSAEQRVADFIIELSTRLHDLSRDPNALYLPMSRYDIGSYLGLAPETVSRTLRRFHDAGVASVNVKQVRIIDRIRLSEIVHSPAAARNLA
jgi:CRP/FNR family transcriptional regulator